MLGYSRNRDILHNKGPDFLGVFKHFIGLTEIGDRGDIPRVGQHAR